MLLAATVSRRNPEPCPLCKLEDVTLPRHIITLCGATYGPRVKLMNCLKIPTKNFNETQQTRLFNKIYDNPHNTNISEYLSIAAASHDLAFERKTLHTGNLGKLTGKILDVRQNGDWYRTKVIRHDEFKLNEVTVDSTNLDDWPEFWAGSSFTLDVEALVNLQALKVRSNNALSFTNHNHNKNKIIYIDNSPRILQKHLGDGIFETNNGKINVRQLIRSGKMNSCYFNGNVARRYNSAPGASPMPAGKD